MTEAFLGLGANLGDRAATLDRAAADLAELGAVRRSHWYETEAVGIGDAPSFLNGAVGIRTDAEPRQLFERTRAIELRLGRDPEHRQGSRTIDIDLLLFGDRIVKDHELTIPHPRMHERPFVLVPLAELAPGAVHPVLGLTVSQLLARLDVVGVRPWSRS